MYIHMLPVTVNLKFTDTVLQLLGMLQEPIFSCPAPDCPAPELWVHVTPRFVYEA